jgi:hypothetical protein
MHRLTEEAGRMVLTDAETHGPARYEAFMRAVISALVAAAPQGAS